MQAVFQDMYTGQLLLFRAILALWTIPASIQFISEVFVSNARQ
jgi:hypothetical protein